MSHPARSQRKVNNHRPRDRQVETRLVASLRPHPRQRELFGTPTAEVVESMMKSIEQNGLMHAIEIVPDGTIIAGHTRRAAIEQLGWQEIQCIVRYDLEAQGEDAVLRYLVNDNLHRRQLSRLHQARVTLALAGYTSGRIRQYGLSEDERKHLASLLQMTPRNVSRWIRALGTPVEIQTAVDRGELTLAQAGQVGYLHNDQQDAIVAAIRSGLAPAKAIAQFVKAKCPSCSANAEFRRFVNATRLALRQLRDRSHEVSPHLAHQHLKTLQQAAAWLRVLMQRGSTEEVAKADQSLTDVLLEVTSDVN